VAKVSAGGRMKHWRPKTPTRFDLNLMRIKLFIFGGRNTLHWCGTCGAVEHPHILIRLLDWMNQRVVNLSNWFWRVQQDRQRARFDRALPLRPGRFIPVNGPIVGESADVVPQEEGEVTWQLIIDHFLDYDPVYHGSTVGEPVPEQFASSPVMIPSRERIIPKQETTNEDRLEYMHTGLLPAFRREVDKINPLAFEPVTGARVVKWNEGGGFMSWVVEVLVGESKTPFGYVPRYKSSGFTWPTASAARAAKSRFLKKLQAARAGNEGAIIGMRAAYFPVDPTKEVK